MNEINQIYDRIMKRIFTLSNLSIINLINGLFSTNYPTNSKVSYPNKEFHNANMKKRVADVYITINDVYTYHIEAQRQSDSLMDFGTQGSFEYQVTNFIYLDHNIVELN